MRRRSRIARISAALASLSVAGSVYAAPPEVEITLDDRVGQSTAPYFTSAFPKTRGYGASFILGGRLDLAENWWVGLRAPLALMRVEQPAGALYAEAAWGNPELSAGLERPWLDRDGWALTLGARLAAGAPLAEHDAAQLAGRALRIADALDGFSEPALFTPGVLPVTPGSSLTLTSPRWKLSAALAVPLLFRVSNADLPRESNPHSFGLFSVVTLEAQLRVLRWLSVACAPRFTARAIAPVDDDSARVQFLAAGRADFHLSDHLLLSALLQAPIGGSLGGSTAAGGLSLRAEF